MMTSLIYSQDTISIDLKPTVYELNGDTNFCFTPLQAKEILIIFQERNTFKDLYDNSEQDSEKCSKALYLNQEVIDTYKSDSIAYNETIIAKDSIITLKGKQLEVKENDIKILKTHRGILGTSTILVLILSLL